MAALPELDSVNSNKLFSGQMNSVQEVKRTLQFYFLKLRLRLLYLGQVGCFFFLASVVWSFHVSAEETLDIFSLKSTIEEAIKVNLKLRMAKEDVEAASYNRNAAQTGFFPTVNTTYQFRHRDEENRSDLFGLLEPRDEYSLVATVTQPIFAGYSIVNSYKIASLGLDIAKINEKLIRREIIFTAQKAYFTLLKAQKLMIVSQEAVALLEALRDVADNFYRVGMTPLNDLLKAEVELANARQDLILARNVLEIAKSNLNTILRRPVNADIVLEDIVNYTSFEKDIDDCLIVAKQNRLEFMIADKEIEVAQKAAALQKRNFYPTIHLEGNYYRLGDEWQVDGGEGIDDSSSWNVKAVASWTLWEWGKTSYRVKESLRRLSQIKYQREQIEDTIHLEVKEAYLNTMESEKNIVTVQKAVEQARENFRISEERYKEQVATSTDVLDARTLLSKTMTNYYNALYDFKIAKASLYRAMGQEVIE